MSWKKNVERFCRIQEKGVTVDLPLFNQAKEAAPKITNTEIMPAKVFVADETKAAAFEAIQPSIRKSQWRVFTALCQLVKATDRQLKDATGLEINVVCGRRNELVKRGLVTACGETQGSAGVLNTLWTIDWMRVQRLADYIKQNGAKPDKKELE